jgi:hypothetical protein
VSAPSLALWLLSLPCGWLCGLNVTDRPGRAAVWAAGCAASFGSCAAVDVAQGYWPEAVIHAAAAAALAWFSWWLWRRRKRKRKALRALGHKARARLAAMVRNMPKPGPVLRPVPQGA